MYGSMGSLKYFYCLRAGTPTHSHLSHNYTNIHSLSYSLTPSHTNVMTHDTSYLSTSAVLAQYILSINLVLAKY